MHEKFVVHDDGPRPNENYQRSDHFGGYHLKYQKPQRVLITGKVEMETETVLKYCPQ